MINIKCLALMRDGYALRVTTADGREFGYTTAQARDWLAAHPNATLRDLARLVVERIEAMGDVDVAARCLGRDPLRIGIIIARPGLLGDLSEGEWERSG